MLRTTLILLTLFGCQTPAAPTADAPSPVPAQPAPVVAPVEVAPVEAAPVEATPVASDDTESMDDAVADAVVEASPATPTDTPPAPIVDDAPSTPAEPAVTEQPVDVEADQPEEATDAVVEQPSEPEPTAQTWTLSPSGSFVAVLVKYDRGAVMGGHDHAVQATRFTGSARWDTADVSACRIEVSVPVSGLRTDPGSSRNRLGLEGSTKDKDKQAIQKNFLGKSQLWSDKHNQITFRSTSCVTKGDRTMVTGDLTIRGVSKRVTAPMRITASSQAFKANGTLSVKHSDFGFKPFTALMGALRNDDALTFTLQFQGSQ